MRLFDGYGKITLIGIFITLPLSCLLVSAQKYYWFDELFSYYFLSDSFSGMVRAFHDKINNTPFVYFFLGWFWAQLFGASEASLRLFSSLSICLAALATWLMLRRGYGPWPAAFATACVFGLSYMVLQQNAEARMYGLYLAFAALAVLQFDRIGAAGACSRRAAVGVAIVHALLLHTHLFGIFYSATIIGVGLLVDALRRRWQPRLYVAYAAAWLSLLAYLPTFLVQADAGRPRTWIPHPTVGDLAFFYTAELGFAWPLLIVLFLVYLWLHPQPRLAGGRSPRGPAAIGRWVAARPTLALGGCLLLLPLPLWLLSLMVKPIFIDRYMIPSLLGVAILLAEVVAAFDRRDPWDEARTGLRSRLRTGLWTLSQAPMVRRLALVALVAVPLAYGLTRHDVAVRNLADYDFGHRDLPIAVQYANSVLQQVHYADKKDSERLVYILDWDSAVSPASGTFPPQEHKHMQALLRNYPERFSGRIVEGDAFLKRNERFLVLEFSDYDRACEPSAPWYSLRRNTNKWKESLQCPRFLEEVILADPRYVTTVAGRIGTGDAYWGDLVVLLVERRPS